MSKITRLVILGWMSTWLACAGDDSAMTARDAAADGDASGGSATAGSSGGAGTGGHAGEGASDGAVDDASNPAADGGTLDGGDAGIADNPHPLYPALDLDALPGPGGAASGGYEPPALPDTTRSVMVTTTGNQASTDLLAACQTAGTAVTVPDTAGAIGNLDFGNVSDCDVTLGADVVTPLVYVGHLPGPQVAPTHRIRIRGGQIGQIMVDPGSSDIVFDGVVVNNAVVPAGQRSGTAIYMMADGAEIVNRFAFVNSIIRMVATTPDGNGDSDGCAYLAGNSRNVFFANDNIVTAGNRNSWGFRISGGENFIVVDSTVRVSFHKLIRMNDGPVDYVYVKGGTWMREATLTSGGLAINDAFAQLGDLGTDHVYVHDTAVHMLSPEPVNIGPWNGPGQVGKSWELRRIAWHARSQDVVSDASLGTRAASCTTGATCDYGVGTHTYDYDDALTLPTDAWRSLPDIAEDDPDAQPIAP